MSVKYCEIRIEPPEDNIPEMGGVGVHRVAVPLANLANVVEKVNETGMRVTAIVEFDAMTAEEFVDKVCMGLPLIAALTRKPKWPSEALANNEPPER